MELNIYLQIDRQMCSIGGNGKIFYIIVGKYKNYLSCWIRQITFCFNNSDMYFEQWRLARGGRGGKASSKVFDDILKVFFFSFFNL